MRRIAFFEQLPEQFSPVALLRPVFELLCGHFTLRERLIRSLHVKEWGAIMRPILAETYAEEHPEAVVNDAEWLARESTLLVNGRCLLDPQVLAGIEPGTAGWIGETLAWIVLEPGTEINTEIDAFYEQLLIKAYDLKHVRTTGTLLSYPWDLVDANADQNSADFELRRRLGAKTFVHDDITVIGDRNFIHIDPSAEVEPFVVFNTMDGPIWIEAGAKVQAFTRIEGPCYIGRDTQLFRANIREGTSIGPVCRVGGEIEESIIHGYTNKYHDGFLGHSYICPWVNLGALSTNSDLKNDYSNVKVPIDGMSINTGSTKVGCFIGDHTKTALCSLFNTGTSVGVMSLILPGGELLPKHVPSYSRIWHGKLESLPDGCESAISTAKTAMNRRNVELTPAAETLLRTLYEETETDRTRAFAWQQKRIAPAEQR